MMRHRLAVLALLLAVPLAAAAATPAPRSLFGGPAAKPVTLPDGLIYTDLSVGTGPMPKRGDTAIVHYTGTLTNGKKFDSSRDRGQPYEFKLGARKVIKCWDEGVATMRIGGRRTLVCPPALAYGSRGYPPVIPPNATLNFEVSLLGIK